MGHDEGFEGAEAEEQFTERVYAALDELLSTDSHRRVVVTHGFAVTVALVGWFSLPAESLGYLHIQASPAGVSVLEEDDYCRNRTRAVERHLTRPVRIMPALSDRTAPLHS